MAACDNLVKGNFTHKKNHHLHFQGRLHLLRYYILLYGMKSAILPEWNGRYNTTTNNNNDTWSIFKIS